MLKTSENEISVQLLSTSPTFLNAFKEKNEDVLLNRAPLITLLNHDTTKSSSIPTQSD
jgi:hypothetical protein